MMRRFRCCLTRRLVPNTFVFGEVNTPVPDVGPAVRRRKLATRDLGRNTSTAVCATRLDIKSDQAQAEGTLGKELRAPASWDDRRSVSGPSNPKVSDHSEVAAPLRWMLRRLRRLKGDS
jgi:hypothetical protein